MASTISERVQKRRNALRMAGLRPVQIWVPDTRQPDFAEQCELQSRLASLADSEDTELTEFMDAALSDMDDKAA